MQDHKLTQVSRRYQQRQADAKALQQEIDALEKRIDHEIAISDADAAAYLPQFLRTAQRTAAHQRVSRAQLADAISDSEAELRTIYQRVTSLRLAASMIVADQAAAMSQSQQAQALETMINQYDRRTRARN